MSADMFSFGLLLLQLLHQVQQCPPGRSPSQEQPQQVPSNRLACRERPSLHSCPVPASVCRPSVASLLCRCVTSVSDSYHVCR